MSRDAQCLSFCVGLIQPSRLAILQQCASTGNTFLFKEYNKTHRATFFPTPGSDSKKDSASLSLILPSGFKVGLPNFSTMISRIVRIAFAFLFASPPLVIDMAIYSAAASAIF